MATINWTTDTMVDHSTGRTVVTVTVFDPTSRPISAQWVSGAPAPAASSLSPTAPVAASVNLGSTDVQSEADAAGMALLAAVNAGTAVAGTVVEANPDPTDAVPVDQT